ncbi:MAG: hypothetical protein ABI120_12920 [Gemmatimonadaceae bacterium]
MPRLDVTLANMNLCDEGEPVRNREGKVIAWNMARKRVNVSAKPNQQTVEKFAAFSFDAEGRQLTYAECILPVGDSASAFMLNYHKTRARTGLNYDRRREHVGSHG